MKKEGSIPTL